MAVLEMAERFFEAMLKEMTKPFYPCILSEKYGLHKALFNKHTYIIMARQPTPLQRTFPPEIAGRSMIRAYENPLVSLDKPGLVKPLFRFWVYVTGGVYFDQVSMLRCVASSPPWSCFLELNPKRENQPAKIGIASIGLVY